MSQFGGQKAGYQPQRLQKITQRPIKQGMGQALIENADVQYAQQQRSVQQKKQEFQEIEERMLKKMYGTKEEKLQIQNQEYQELQQHAQLQQEFKRKQREEERKIEMQMIEQIKYQEMIEKEKKQAEEEYKQYLAFQAKQQEELKLQNKNMQKQMDRVDDQEQINKFFQKHFGKSIR